MKAIPTEYKGCRFRSRLEARWAAFFDRLGWPWEYEPFDLNGWSPDFQLGKTLLVEVKPYRDLSEFYEHGVVHQIDNAMTGDEKTEVLLVGTSPFIDENAYVSDFAGDMPVYSHDSFSIGWLGERGNDDSFRPPTPASTPLTWTWTGLVGSYAYWDVPRDEAGMLYDVFSPIGSPRGRVFGHTTSWSPFPRFPFPVQNEEMFARWRMACSDVQWIPKTQEAS